MRYLKGQVSFDSSYSEVYKTLWPQVYRYIYYRVQNDEEAQELAQDVFHKVYPHFVKQSFDESKVRAYIFATTRNVLRDLWRKKKDVKIINLEDVSEIDLIDEKNIVNKAVEDALVVKEAIKELKEDEIKVITYRIIKGYSVKEVAKMMSKPQGTVKSIQYRALEKLRKILLKGGFFNEQR